MKTNYFFFVSLFLLITSCNNSSVFNEGFDFPKNQWQKKNPQSFVFTIDDATLPHDITFSLSHVYDYQFASAPLSFKWTKPDGTSEVISVDFKFKDENGKELGDCAGDICDLKHTLISKTLLQKGEHQITVSHSFQFDYLPNIIHIGLNVSTTK